MRTSLQQLHSRLGTTTVYVTHDQVEAMTLGQRVAVMQDGRLQQVDVPQRLYEEPVNLFVAAFIGSPAMNLVSTSIEDDSVLLGPHRIPLARDRRPQATADGRVVVGIRPEAFEDVAYADEGLPQFDIDVEVVEELGSDAYLFFEVDATPVVVEQALSDEGDEATLLAVERERALFAARVDPRSSARAGGPARVALDPARLYFFSPDTGESLLGRTAAAA
jgi:multiple sugar transport system ATP-binding protein